MLCQTSCQLFLCLIPRFEDIEIQVQKTNERITQDLDIYLIPSNPVFWKESTESNSVMVARDENKCVMTISVASGTLNDRIHQSATRKPWDSNQPTLSSLVTTEEEDWPIEVTRSSKATNTAITCGH